MSERAALAKKINIGIGHLEAVLCDPSGNCCIDGSDGDRQAVNAALTELRQAAAALSAGEGGATIDVMTEFVIPKKHCCLCGNYGIIDTRGRMYTPAGYECGDRVFCVCPNGRWLKAGGADLYANPSTHSAAAPQAPGEEGLRKIAADIVSRNPLVCGPCGASLPNPECGHKQNGVTPCCIPQTDDLEADIFEALRRLSPSADLLAAAKAFKAACAKEILVNGAGFTREFVEAETKLSNAIRAAEGGER